MISVAVNIYSIKANCFLRLLLFLQLFLNLLHFCLKDGHSHDIGILLDFFDATDFELENLGIR